MFLGDKFCSPTAPSLHTCAHVTVLNVTVGSCDAMVSTCVTHGATTTGRLWCQQARDFQRISSHVMHKLFTKLLWLIKKVYFLPI